MYPGKRGLDLFFLFFRIVVGFVFIVFVSFFFDVVLVIFFVFILFFVLVSVEIVRNGIQMHGVRLRDFEFDFTLWAAQDFALLDFVFVHIKFGATIGAANHGTILRTKIRVAGESREPPPTVVLYTANVEVNPQMKMRRVGIASRS